MRGKGPQAAGDLLAEMFRRKGMKRPLKRAEVVILWPRVVGREVASFSTARAFTNGVLMVDVTDSETAMHLSMQRQRFIAVYHDTYGLTDVKDVRFQAGRVTAADGNEAANGRDAEPVDPGDIAALERAVAEADLPEDTASVVRAAAHSVAAHWARQRAAGHGRCPTCGALHDGELPAPLPRERRLAELGRRNEAMRDRPLCPSCRRSAREPRVLAAARRLAFTPSEAADGLSDDEIAVAKRLASIYLDDAIEDLLPRAVSDPALRPLLERAARCRVELETGKPAEDLTDRDMRALDERVARFLGWSWS